MQARGPGHAGMHHVIRTRSGLVLKSRDVVVLDIIPFGVEYVEDIERGEPLARLPEADLRIHRGIRSGSRAVVFDQRRRAKMARAQRTEPAGLPLCDQTRVEDVGGAVGNVAPDNRRRRRAGERSRGGPTAQIIRRRVAIEARPGDGRVNLRRQPGIESIGIGQFETRTRGRPARRSDSRVAAEHQFGFELQTEEIERGRPAGHEGRGKSRLGAGGPRERRYRRRTRILAAASHAARVVAVITIRDVDEVCRLGPRPEDQRQFWTEYRGTLVAGGAAQWIAVEGAAAARLQLVLHVKIELILAYPGHHAKRIEPPDAALRVQRTVRFQDAGVLSGADDVPLERGKDPNVADIIGTQLYAENIRNRESRDGGMPGLRGLEPIHHAI